MLKRIGLVASVVWKVTSESVELKYGVRFAFGFTMASSVRAHDNRRVNVCPHISIRFHYQHILTF
jgi:hypothetical protein